MFDLTSISLPSGFCCTGLTFIEDETSEVYGYMFFHDESKIRIVEDYKFKDIILKNDNAIYNEDTFKLTVDVEYESYEFDLSNLIPKEELDLAIFKNSDTSNGVDVLEDVDAEKKDSIVSKIKKMLSLSQNNPSVEEAYSALLLAQKMKYQYSIDDIDDGIGFKSHKIFTTKDVKQRYSSMESYEGWKEDLVRLIAENFNCFYYWKGRRKGANCIFVIVGLEEDAEVAMMTYEFARNVCVDSCRRYLEERKREEKILFNKMYSDFIVEQYTHGLDDSDFDQYYNEPNYKNLKYNYCEGFVEGLKKRYEEQVISMALVLVKDDAVIEVQENTKLKKVDVSKSHSSSLDRASYTEGYKRGKSLNNNEIRD